MLLLFLLLFKFYCLDFFSAKYRKKYFIFALISILLFIVLISFLNIGKDICCFFSAKYRKRNVLLLFLLLFSFYCLDFFSAKYRKKYFIFALISVLLFIVLISFLNIGKQICCFCFKFYSVSNVLVSFLLNIRMEMSIFVF